MFKLAVFLAVVAVAYGGVIAPIVPVAHPVLHHVGPVVHPVPLVHPVPVVHPVVHHASLIAPVVVKHPVVPIVKHAPLIAVHHH